MRLAAGDSRTSWLSLGPLLLFPRQRSLARRAAPNLTDVSVVPSRFLLVFLFAAINVVRNPGMDNLVAQLEMVLEDRSTCRHFFQSLWKLPVSNVRHSPAR